MKQAVREILDGGKGFGLRHKRPLDHRRPLAEWPFEPNLSPGVAEFWGRALMIGLAKQSCHFCHGLGWRELKFGKDAPCNCVFRSVFRACFNRYRELRITQAHAGHVHLTYSPKGRDTKRTYSRKREEYLADFELIAKRELDSQLWEVFGLHFLQGWDWKFCVRNLQMDRGSFFHAVYRIEQKLGRVYREVKPYCLYPLREYFEGIVQSPEALYRIPPNTSHMRRVVTEMLPANEGPQRFHAAAGGM
ncbi:MAG: hypothetical protein ABSC23_03865 [Bryobacteraceae bacterium]|jgi:hypothetical protein